MRTGTERYHASAQLVRGGGAFRKAGLGRPIGRRTAGAPGPRGHLVSPRAWGCNCLGVAWSLQAPQVFLMHGLS